MEISMGEQVRMSRVHYRFLEIRHIPLLSAEEDWRLPFQGLVRIRMAALLVEVQAKEKEEEVDVRVFS
jgi:hypothetical protein